MTRFVTARAFVTVCTVYASFAALGCARQKPADDPGPAERAGAKVDEGAASAKDSAKKAGEKVGDATERAGDKLKEKSNP